MKRTISLILALVLVLALVPAVSADVIFEPEDTFYWDHRDECQYHNRAYYAAGPDGAAAVYRSPEAAAVVERVKNGGGLWISYIYEDGSGISWGYCENFEENWSGWVPMDYLLLCYDFLCFQEEFADRIAEETGAVAQTEGEIYFWDYPGSDYASTRPADAEYPPEYHQTFVDDAGRKWGYIGYYMGARSVWVCLDDPDADYDTLYAENPPQQVTHPVQTEAPDEIKPGGPGMGAVLAVVGIVAAVSGGFLLITRKKK